MSKREPQIILKTDERKVLLELGLEGKFAAKSMGWDEKPGLPRRGPVGDRSQGRPLGPMPCARPAGGAQTGAALLPRRRVTAQQRPGTALRCAVTSGVEAGNGVADEEAERLGGASQTGRRCLRVALAGHLSNRF